jgi:hypothetical protein
MFASHDTTLQGILTAIDASRIPPAQQAALCRLQQEVKDFLAHRFKGDLVCAPWPLGSPSKRMATSLDHETELVVVFRHGGWGDLAGMKAEVLKELARHFGSMSTEVREQRFSIGIRRLFGVHTLSVDVLPGMETAPGSYVPEGGDEEAKFLLLHDRMEVQPRLGNLHRHLRLIQGMGAFCDIVKLLKAWRHQEGHLIGSCALEMLVLLASRDTQAIHADSLTDRFRHVLRFCIHFLESDQPLIDVSTQQLWPDYLSVNSKILLAQRWKQLLHALQAPDMRSLRAFLPVFSS